MTTTISTALTESETSTINNYIFRCNNSPEGIFTALYDAWDSGISVPRVHIEITDSTDTPNYTLFSEYIDVDTDNTKAFKVARSLNFRLSHEIYELVMECIMSCNPDKGDIAFRFLKKAFHVGPQIIKHLADPDVAKLLETTRSVMNEAHFYREFIRFEETEDGALLGKIEPQNNVALFVIPHFRDRFPDDTIIIYDTGRNLAAFSKPDAPTVLASLSDEEADLLKSTTEDEECYRIMWKVYHSSIAIKERTNLKPQANLCRKRFRKYMTEFI